MLAAQAKAALRRTCRLPRAASSVPVSAPLQAAPSKWNSRRQTPRNDWKLRVIGALAAGLALGSSLCEQPADNEEEHGAPAPVGEARPELPTFTFEEVQKHTGAHKSGTWVVYRHGVYDITRFIVSHPGGTKILLAAGNSIEPFWQLYAAHNHADVHKILEKLRIGNLREEDVEMLEALRKERYGDGPYSKDPTRHPALKVNSSMPFNAEPPAELLMESFITPNDLFFVRNHLPVPEVDAEHFTLKVSGLGIGKGKQVEFTLDDLKSKFKHHTVTTTVQCAGNRRAEMSGVKQVNGLSWDTTALSTANWTGVLLSDVLASIGITDEDSRQGQCDCEVGENLDVCGDCNAVIQHVQFQGLDADTEGNTYGASIPVATALDPRKDVLLAFEMNGETIPRDHGFPLRELPVQSAITEPKNGSVHLVDDASDSSIVTVKGYAWSGGGRNIIRVDISADGGKTWTPAELHESGKRQKYNRAWAWTPWELDVEVPPGTKKLDIMCKAVDASYNVQPDTIAPIWNMRGVLNNAWHRVHVSVEESDEEEEEEEEEEDVDS
ncbi:Sulfite oxidase, mitochondrial [Phytophthora ramorum]|uniref:Sulfite oxidase, mitochondrial n=1 Tax=Phytophthora ramorum TaxID=164328 RepID=UPI0030A596CB|nr:Sulfite oxidase, mitochondrial [Phytophthora ramorum]